MKPGLSVPSAALRPAHHTASPQRLCSACWLLHFFELPVLPFIARNPAPTSRQWEPVGSETVTGVTLGFAQCLHRHVYSWGYNSYGYQMHRERGGAASQHNPNPEPLLPACFVIGKAPPPSLWTEPQASAASPKVSLPKQPSCIRSSEIMPWMPPPSPRRTLVP